MKTITTTNRAAYIEEVRFLLSKIDDIIELDKSNIADYPEFESEYNKFGEGYYHVEQGFISNPRNPDEYHMNYDMTMIELEG